MTKFLSMGGYADFVWPAYIFAALVLLGVLLFSLREAKRNAALLAEVEAASPRRGRRKEDYDDA